MVQRPPMYVDFGDGFWNWLYRLILQGNDQIDEAPLVYLKLLRAFYLRFHKLSPLFAEAFPHLGTQKCSKVPPISPKAGESFQTWKLGFQGFFWWDLGTLNQSVTKSQNFSRRGIFWNSSGPVSLLLGTPCNASTRAKQPPDWRKRGKAEKPNQLSSDPKSVWNSYFIFSFYIGIFEAYVCFFYWRLLWPILWQMILVKTQICWMAWTLFLFAPWFFGAAIQIWHTQRGHSGWPSFACLKG